MKFTPLNTILAINIVLDLVATGVIGVMMGDTSGYGSPWGWGVLISGFFLVAGNIALSILFVILAAFAKGERAKVLGQCSQGFILSAGVVLLMAVPMCLMSAA